jgi:hypothetical protein
MTATSTATAPRASLLDGLRSLLRLTPSPALPVSRKAQREEYLEGAYRSVLDARTEVMNRGTVVIADTIRDTFPTADRITIDAQVCTLDAVYAGDTRLWVCIDISDRVFCEIADDLEAVLRDVLGFGQDHDDLLDAGWLTVDRDNDKYDIQLPDVTF